jgi:hypothetical protein
MIYKKTSEHIERNKDISDEFTLYTMKTVECKVCLELPRLWIFDNGKYANVQL